MDGPLLGLFTKRCITNRHTKSKKIKEGSHLILCSGSVTIQERLLISPPEMSKHPKGIICYQRNYFTKWIETKPIAMITSEKIRRMPKDGTTNKITPNRERPFRVSEEVGKRAFRLEQPGIMPICISTITKFS
ncbi:hypothetical protein CR513_52616, partial [Mucuna pruriens]